jgi:hypothetical protein
MRKEVFSGKVENFYGKPITELGLKEGFSAPTQPLQFDGSFDAFGPDKDVDTYTDSDWDEALEELKAKHEFPTNREIVMVANNKRKAKERQRAMQNAVNAAGLIQPNLENDPQLRLKRMYDVYRANGKSHEVAMQKAAQELELEWDGEPRQ